MYMARYLKDTGDDGFTQEMLDEHDKKVKVFHTLFHRVLVGPGHASAAVVKNHYQLQHLRSAIQDLGHPKHYSAQFFEHHHHSTKVEYR
jgi:hypothetical protein